MTIKLQSKPIFPPLAFLIPFFAILLLAVPARANNNESLRGERVCWARLKTASPHWKGHAESDPRLMQFFREQTTLNIDPTWYEADVEKLSDLCAYPFLFSQSIIPVISQNGRTNLGEYVRRGGFLLIDACINPGFRGDPNAFISGQIRTLGACLPEARVVEIPKDHEIFRCLYRLPDGPPHTEDHAGWGDHPFLGIYIGPRLAGVISTSGMQCGWAGMKQVYGHNTLCMKMLVNIYVYAMLHAG